ncbi:nuclear receptor subfamily 1 group I member 2-like isoform X4 [Onychostruthus taczanowskii]|uniref:nuclear receptor subfamily 1 group I member 2-like isoform X4 n=1 Tax=Onychostruthus taczanowskii TaxID=356909 RepID=UPI001B80A65D|nr:nuclear receptor subfamily 1 group I member 2-like isoform X4 [Onychostruthus taczanowskii]
MEGTHGDRQRHAGTAGDTRGPDVPSPTAPGDSGSAVSLPSPPGTERSPRDPPGDTEPDGDKVCAVCGDRANGYHFHVMSCEGCKGFFRRSIIKGVRFTCPLARRCPVTKAKRRQCQACRLQKCLDVGMRRDMIMSEEALRRRRELRGQRGQPGGQRGQPGGQRGQEGLTAEQQELIALLIGAHQRTFDSSFSQFMHCWPAVRLLAPSPPGAGVAAGVSLSPCEEALPDVLSLLPQFADLSTFMIQQEFAAGGADLAAERSHAGDLPDPLQHHLQPRHQGLGVRPALLHHPRRGPGRCTWSRCSSSTRACGGCGCTRPSTPCCRPCCSSRLTTPASPSAMSSTGSRRRWR